VEIGEKWKFAQRKKHQQNEEFWNDSHFRLRYHRFLNVHGCMKLHFGINLFHFCMNAAGKLRMSENLHNVDRLNFLWIR
jgi:hypothetical protein